MAHPSIAQPCKVRRRDRRDDRRLPSEGTVTRPRQNSESPGSAQAAPSAGSRARVSAPAALRLTSSSGARWAPGHSHGRVPRSARPIRARPFGLAIGLETPIEPGVGRTDLRAYVRNELYQRAVLRDLSPVHTGHRARIAYGSRPAAAYRSSTLGLRSWTRQLTPTAAPTSSG